MLQLLLLPQIFLTTQPTSGFHLHVFFPTKNLLRNLSSLILMGGEIWRLIRLPLLHPSRAPIHEEVVPPLQQQMLPCSSEHSLWGGLEAEAPGEAAHVVMYTNSSSCQAFSVTLTNVILTFRNYFCIHVQFNMILCQWNKDHTCSFPPWSYVCLAFRHACHGIYFLDVAKVKRWNQNKYLIPVGPEILNNPLCILG